MGDMAVNVRDGGRARGRGRSESRSRDDAADGARRDVDGRGHHRHHHHRDRDRDRHRDRDRDRHRDRDRDRHRDRSRSRSSRSRTPRSRSRGGHGRNEAAAAERRDEVGRVRHRHHRRRRHRSRSRSSRSRSPDRGRHGAAAGLRGGRESDGGRERKRERPLSRSRGRGGGARADYSQPRLPPRAPLKIYGRRPTSAANALVEVKIAAGETVGALAKALAAVLQLSVPPDAVVLTLLDERDVAVKELTDAKATLEATGVASGATVIVDVPPAFPPLPRPFVFTEEDVGGERMFVGVLDDGGASAPIFLTKVQHARLLLFIDEAPSRKERMLMVDGTVKGGKSTILVDVLPGLLAWRYHAPPSPQSKAPPAPPTPPTPPGAPPSASAACGDASAPPPAPPDAPQPARPSPSGAQPPAPATVLRRVLSRPVIFKYAFPLSGTATAAAHDFMRAVGDFAHSVHVPFDVPETAFASLGLFPTLVARFAEDVRARGGELWLLVDELQGPVVGAETTAEAEKFVLKFKDVRHGAFRGGYAD